MSKFLGIIVGGVEIAAGILLEFVPGFQVLGGFLIASGAGAVIGNVGTLLSQPQGGLGTASRNPVMPWNVVYGRAKVGGTIVYINSFGDNDKYLDLVFVLASHTCLAVDALCFDNKRVPISPTTKCSYTPTQQTINITSIVRAYGIVTVTMAGAISDLQPGDQVQIQNISGTGAFDRSLNGVIYVYEVISTTKFTYLSGGLDITLGTTGQVKTLWPDYRSKVYCETLLGDQTATFAGMMNGTPYDGDTGNLVIPDAGTSPWSDGQHILNGKTCAMIRLHYNDEVFSSGLPQISWRIRGKKDIYDPRNGTAIASPTVLLNGWGPHGHVGPYEGGVDLGYTWGTDGGTTNPYGAVAAATDGNPSTASIISARATHQYFGCVWTFPATTGATYLSVLSEVPSSGPGSLRSASLYYSLDSGSTWTEIYDAAVRAEQWDNVSLPGGQDTSLVQVMAFMDSHDDMTHHIYEIQVGSGPASGVNGYTENAALCTADYLANTVWGFKATYGSEIPLTPLITAANICDEPVPLADGSTEPRYACNGGFQLSTSRGEILQNMLTACGGRVTYSSGQFIIHPAYWPGTTLYLGDKRPSTVVFKITTSHILGGGMSGNGVITLNLAPYDPASNPFTLWVQSDLFVFDNTGWTNRVNSSTLAYDPATGLVTVTATGAYSGGSRTSSLQDFCVTCYSSGTVFGTASPADMMEVFDMELDLTYPDLSTAKMKPTRAVVIPATTGSGTVSNAANAVDSDATTYATVSRTSFSSLGDAPGIQMTDFRLVGTGPGAPDLSPVGILGSVPLLGMAAGPYTWRPKLPIRELYNGSKGMFISPANGWQNSDFPPYAQDADHGYSGPADFEGDQNLADDGGDRRWLEIQLPFTISPFAAQRLAKIELMRKRQQGTGTFAFNMSLYQTTALDIVAFTLPMLGWSEKLLEISAHRLLLNKQETNVTIGCELDLQETDPSVYEWSVTEQLAPQGPGYGVMPNTQVVGAVTGVTAVSGSTTTVTGADGISRSSILVSWTAPTDGFVVNGGHIEVEYQLATSPLGAWTAVPTVNPSVTQAYIGGVADGSTYNVQVRAVNAAGVPGAWTAAAPVTVSGTATSLPPANIAQGGATTGQVLTWTGTTWVPTTPTGGTGGGGSSIIAETPAGTMNGTNTVFTLSVVPNPPADLLLFVNGIEQKASIDYTLASNTITFAIAPVSSDWLWAYYNTTGTGTGGGMGAIGITIDGGGAVPAIGLKGSVALPFGFTITGWSMEATDGTTGSASIDIWALTGSAPPAAPPVPAAANKISASAPVAMTGMQSAAGGTSAISTWTTALPQYSQVSFYLSSIMTSTRITITIYGTKS